MIRLRTSLGFVVLLPVLTLMLVAGIALYFLVLRTVGDYADASIRSNLASLLVNAVTIADTEVDRQNREARLDDPSAALLYQLNARMRFEDFARDQEVGLIIAVDGVPEFTTGMRESDAGPVVKSLPIAEPGRFDGPGGESHYLSTAIFTPWNWQIILAKDAKNFDALISQVRGIYAGSAIGLVLVAGLLLIWLRQALVQPIYSIANEFSEGRAPSYKGVKELEHLSASIGAMLGSLQAKTLHLETTLESMTEGISVVDADLRLVAWNQHYMGLYRFPEGFLRQGMKFADIMHYVVDRGDYGSVDLDVQLAEMVERARSLTPPRFEINRADGTSMEVRRGRMPDGGFVTTLTDITDRKQRIRFEAANEAKSQFLQNISHDLRKPITAIVEDVRLALSGRTGKLPKEVNATCENVRANAAHLLSMIDVLLEMSRVEAGQVEVKAGLFAMEPVMTQVLKTVKPSARVKGLDVKIEVEDGIEVRSDRRLLTRIIMNLASNAIENTAAGHVSLSARRNGANLEVAVADTGTGIPADKQEMIFEKFQRVEPTAGFTKPGMGLGLGLAISREFARLLGGRLTVTSEVGKGSVFSLSIPIEFGREQR